ncbi:MAG: alpha-ketoacid dehydrogenase subunit beta [Thermoplasmata archaeon]
MSEMNIVGAVNHALLEEMQRDDRVILLGEDIGKNGGVFRCTEGLFEEFGPERVIDTPLAESGIIGASIGMAFYGLRPVPEIQFLDFIYPAFDQIVSEAAKFRYRSGGEYPCQITIRAPYGGGIKGGHYHSQSTETYFSHTPGLKVVIPSGPYDTKGLLLASIRDPDPVLFLEPKRIYRAGREEVPEGDYTVPLGEAKVVRAGNDVSLFAYGAMIPQCLGAAEQAEEVGISCEVVDLRTLVPLDVQVVLDSAQKTGRVVIVYEATKFLGYGAEIAAILAEKAIEYLEAPIVRVAGPDTPFPYTYEDLYLPDAARVLDAVEKVYSF